MMFRTTSQKLVDAVINHPSVRPTMEQGGHRLCSGNLLSRPGVMAFASEYGVILLEQPEPRTFRAHFAFLPHGRGAVAINSCRYVRDLLYREYNAQRIVASIPWQLRAARLCCRRVGLRSVGRDLFDEHFILEAEQWAE